MLRKIALSATVVSGIAVAAASAHAATLVAQYDFGNTLASSVSGSPSLTAVDPTGTSGYSTDTVFGVSQTVYDFNGSATPLTSQGGLTFNNSGNLVGSSSYSVEMIFKLDDRTNAWRRILDSLNRTSDSGFYVDPSNQLDVYPVSGSLLNFTTGVYYDIVLTNDGGNVTVYADGVGEFSLNTTVMNISSDNILGFFLDNTAGGGLGEWSSGSVAMISIYDGALTADDVTRLFHENTSTPSTTVPEPASLALLSLGACAVGVMRSRRRSAQR